MSDEERKDLIAAIERGKKHSTILFAQAEVFSIFNNRNMTDTLKACASCMNDLIEWLEEYLETDDLENGRK